MSKGKWMVSVRRIYKTYDNVSGSTKCFMDRIKSNELQPRSNWENFMFKMNELQVCTLPDLVDIPDLKDGYMDGYEYPVEFATKDQYRVYSYHVPEHYRDKYWQSKNMIAILNLIDSELGIPWNSEDNRWRYFDTWEVLDKTADSIIFDGKMTEK